MKISLNHIRYYQNKYSWSADVAPEGVEALAGTIGRQLGAVEEVTQYGQRFEGVLVVDVVSCVDHPQADRLHICKIDDGGAAADVERDEQGLVQVVCGAPNVREGIKVAWLPPGSTVPESRESDPFVLEARPLRGVVSNGMLASPRELTIGDNHDGILEVDEDVTAGTPFAVAYNLQGDVLIDMENKMFTHRPDCFGMIGVAREIAGIQHQQFKSPDWYRHDAPLETSDGELRVEVKNEIPELVPRFVAVPMRNVTVKPSPIWLQICLSRLGIRPINNVVDQTNYYMILTGQPLHAYDYDKVVAQDAGADHATLVVRNPREGEKITLLNGKEITPRSEAIMIATKDTLIGVGGVMGGADTEVDENTKNIILECANFDMYSIRRTSMAHGLFTDAVTRFNKGQSPLQNVAVLAQIVRDLQTFVGAQLGGRLVDDNHLPVEVLEQGSLHPAVTLSKDFVNERLGFDLSAEEMATLLRNVEFDVTVMGDQLTAKAPFWRTDIEIPEDIVEEVGRLYGFDHLPLKLPKRDLTPVEKDALLEAKAEVRTALATAGASEVLTYSFVHGNVLARAAQDKAQAYQVANALSPDLQYYRLSLTPSLLDKIHPNVKSGHGEFALFEIGKAHVKGQEEENLPKEFERVALVFAADKKTAEAYAGAPFYQARMYLMQLLRTFGLADLVTLEPIEDMNSDVATTYYAKGRAATIKLGETTIGRIGEYAPAVRKAFKLPDFCAGFEVSLTALLENRRANSYQALPRFPKVTQDITLRVPAAVAHASVYQLLKTFVSGQTAAEAYYVSVESLDIYQAADADTKNLTFRVAIASYERTLTDDAVNKLLDEAAAAAHGTFGAERV